MDIKKLIKGFCKEHQLEILEIESKDFAAFWVAPSALKQLLSFVNNNKEMRFTVLTDLFGVDFPTRKDRFEIVYSLLSLKLNQRLLIKVNVEENESVPSITDIFSAACWYEREVFDMYGVNFTDSPDLRRILTDYGFKGHPLRKDFPVTGHVEMRYDEKLEKVIYEPVKLDQEFRDFDFASPWQGPGRYNLPGDEKATKDE